MKKVFILLSLLALSTAALAQFTTVTGTVIDPHSVPYALGTIVPVLVIPSGAGSPTLNGTLYIPPSQAVGLNMTGSFSFNVADNNVLLPAGTKWNFVVCSAVGTVQPAIGTGPQCFSLAAPITITGPTQSLTANLNAVALSLTIPLGGGGGTPAAPNGSTQTNNGGVFGSVASVATGSAYVSAGTLTPPVFQTKPEIDARDIGVDCTFTNDSSAALNALTNNAGFNGKSLRFPDGCHFKLANTWVIKNAAAFRITAPAGGTAGGSPAVAAAATWTGAAGGTMIDMEYVDGFDFENLTIDGGGIADIAINIDRTGVCAGCVNTTDGIFRRLGINAFATGAGSRATWIGIQISAVSSVNVEDMRILDSTFFCSNVSPPVGTAIVIGNSANAKNEIVHHNNIHKCGIGIWQKSGGMEAEYNELGDNALDIRIDLFTDPNESVSYNLSESATFTTDHFLQMTQTIGLGIKFAGNNIPVNGVCAVETFGNWLSSGANTNIFYSGVGGAVGPKVCNGGANPAVIYGGLRTLLPGDLATYASQTNVHNNAIGPFGAAAIGWVNNAASFMLQSTGSLIMEKSIFYTPGDNQMSFANIGSGNTQSDLPCAQNTYCGFEGSYEVSGVWSPGNPFTTTCTVTGADVSTHHMYYVSAVDAGGIETFLGPVNAANCNGPAVFDGTHFETIRWVAVPTAATYNVYAADVATPLHVNQIATGIAVLFLQFNGPYPGAFPITTQVVTVNKTIMQFFRGKQLNFQSGILLNGYSDEASTLKWKIDSTNGKAQFNTYTTLTNCGASGTAANPSVVTCGSAAAGAVTCDVASSAGTCVINTTAVTANSEIFAELTTSENARLGVTCNTSPSVLPAIPVAAKSAGVSFTLNMPTIAANPACFVYHIVN